MDFWLETGDLPLIEKANAMGLLFGVMTHPKIVADSGKELETLLEEIFPLQSGPVVVPVTAHDAATMMKQAEALFGFSDRIIIGIPATSEGMKAVYHCTQKKIPTMVTSVFDQNHVLLAASAGASYIAPCFSHICADDMNGIDSVRLMLRLMACYPKPAKLVATSLLTQEQVRECAEIGAHGVVVGAKVFKELTEDHPLTVQNMQHSVKDWAGAKKRRLPL